MFFSNLLVTKSDSEFFNSNWFVLVVEKEASVTVRRKLYRRTSMMQSQQDSIVDATRPKKRGRKAKATATTDESEAPAYPPSRVIGQLATGRDLNDLCAKTQVTHHDVNLFGLIVQILILIIVVTLVSSNIYSILAYCNGPWQQRDPSTCRCALNSCHYGFSLLSFMFINLIGITLFAYDRYQMNNHGYRVKNWFLLVIIWCGGWVSAWPLMIILKYKRHGEDGYWFWRLAFVFTILSVTGPVVISTLIS
jgi:uncharacterized membrane protein YsdA (DUF1294 family)